jgi:hypothetical protein
MEPMVAIIKVIKKLFTSTSYNALAAILSTDTSREELLGMRKIIPPTQERILEDATRIVNYSSKQDYRVWSQEAWAKALSHIDALQSPKLTTEELHFHRGALTGTLDLIRVSYQARLVKDDLEKNPEESVSSVH